MSTLQTSSDKELEISNSPVLRKPKDLMAAYRGILYTPNVM